MRWIFRAAPSWSRTALRGACLGVVLLAGCGGAQTGQVADKGFFPPPPATPRLQYLGSISDSRDVEGRQSQFALLALGEAEKEDIRFIIKPYGVTAQGSRIYVCDTVAARVVVIDPAAKQFEYLKGNFGFGKLKKPINAAVGPAGELYVADAGRGEVMVYDASGNYRTAFGKQLDMKPTDVAVDAKILYVNDFKSSEVKMLDRRTGELLGAIGREGDDLDEKLSLPTNLAVDGRGFVHVTNMATGRVIRLDRDGHVLHAFGQLGDAFGEFGRPKGIAVDHENRVFVVDASHQNVQIFRDDGRILLFFGDPNSPYGALNLPAGIEVTRDNLAYWQTQADPAFQLEAVVYVTSQFGDKKLNVYGLGSLEE